MATIDDQKLAAVDEANVAYLKRQEAMRLDFKSPFLALNATLQDCVTQRAELGISDEEFERDKATFNHSIIDAIAKHGIPDTFEKVDCFFLIAHSFVGNAMKQPNAQPNYWPLVACHAALVTLHHEQQKEGFVTDAAMTNVALFAQHMMNIAWKPERMRQHDGLLAGLHTLSNQQQATNRVLNDANRVLLPRAQKGDKFAPGKPKGALSPLATAVKKYLAKHRDASANDVWKELVKTPPTGHTFCDNSLGRYVEYDRPEKNTSWARFQNIVSEQRPKR